MTENGGTSLLPTTILRDAREQHPWEFEKIPVDTRDVTLSTGDYAVPAHCSYDPKLETYHPVFAVERKTGPDLLNSITWERNRFEREIQRASHWEQPLS